MLRGMPVRIKQASLPWPIPSNPLHCGCITKVTVIAGMRPPGPTLDNPGNSSTAVPARPHRARSTGRAIPKGGEIP